MNLSSHFTLAELTKTEIRKYDNTPPNAILPNLKRMAEMLEDVRTLLGGKPIIINSCYRRRLGVRKHRNIAKVWRLISPAHPTEARLKS